MLIRRDALKSNAGKNIHKILNVPCRNTDPFGNTLDDKMQTYKIHSFVSKNNPLKLACLKFSPCWTIDRLQSE